MENLVSQNNIFHKGRYTDLVARRGWTDIFWKQSIKCSCWSDITGSPDYKCPTCSGTGWLYSDNLNVEIINEIAKVLPPNKLVLQCSFLPYETDATRTVTRVLSIFNRTQNVTYTHYTISGNQLTVTDMPVPTQDDVIIVSYVYQRDVNVPMRAIITNVDYKNNYIPAGEWLAGDIILTVEDCYSVGFRDRIMQKDNYMRTTEQFRRNVVDVHSISLEKLLYDTTMGLKNVTCRDKYVTYTQDTDFKVLSDGTISWNFVGASGSSPRHKSFQMVYTGAGAVVTMTITGLSLTTVVDGNPDLNLLFSAYPTLQTLVDAINNTTTYAAVISQDAQEKDTYAPVMERTTYLVAASAVSIKTTPYQVWNIDATQYAVEYFHYALWQVNMQVSQSRHPDGGTLLVKRFWCRLYENLRRTPA